MDKSQTPQVRVPGETPESTQPEPNATANHNSTEVEMGETQDTSQPEPEHVQEDSTLSDVQAEPELPAPAKKNAGCNFLDFLTSPIVEIIVGKGDDETVMTAHQSLLMEAPLLAELLRKFEASGPRRINLSEEDVDAFGCFLQFQYTRDYTVVQTETPGETVEDKSGDELLRHARIYTLAEKLGLPKLQRIAHGKIHNVQSSPDAELSYARYVYTHTPATDTTIRKPVATYWASQSHLLRQEVGDNFKKLCIEVPEFSFDVLTIILDRKLKNGSVDEIKGSARKRRRDI
ncbi:hypothetical protein CBS147333_9941 [Penicillium roqueforti]|nr:hypothetical protein CBS147333_9941 [Penicillium roqueforti]KAI3270123.1 hypothetical protein CBS147308_4973 [Penicillium roqueforti]KAI3290708.1 hypothetical protein DTO003C3_4691 [Penicillium roqueforti]KAI3300915.1 hypothetical protein DTO002I6_105 [Penicillium roqueforti]